MTEKQVSEIAKKKLQEDGYTYWFPPRTWGERDILGVFDFIAARGTNLIMVQLTTIQHLSDRRKKIQNFYRANNIGPLRGVFVWAYHPVKETWKIEKIT